MGVFNAAGTRLSKSSALALTAADTTDPFLVATADLYDSVFTGQQDASADGNVRRLLLKAGRRIATSQFNLLFPFATLDTFAPSAAIPAAGGSTVVITGTYLDGITAITIGGTAATSFVVSQAGKVLSMVVPAKTAGTYNVVVTDDSGTVTATNALTFV